MTEPTDKHREEARELLQQDQQAVVANWLAQQDPPEQIVNRIASALSARDTETREVLEGLAWAVDLGGGEPVMHWCDSDEQCTPECEAARALYSKLNPDSTSEP